MSDPVQLSPELGRLMSSLQKSSDALQAEEAERRGCTVDELHAAWAAEREVDARRASLITSRISITEADIETIATGQQNETEAIDIVRRWSDYNTSRPFLILCGDCGRGKTFAGACWIADQGCGIATKAAEIGDAIRTIDMRHKALVIDDLGAEPKQWTQNSKWASAFIRLVEGRMTSGKTLITSNLLREDFAKRYDERTIARLDSASHVVHVGGDQMRASLAGLVKP